MRPTFTLLVLMLMSACRKPVEVRMEAGDAAAARGDWAEARTQWQQAAELDATSVTARTHLGFAAWRLGDLDGARAAWLDALKLAPQNAEAGDGLARLALDARDAGAALALPASAPVRVRALLMAGQNALALQEARALAADDEGRFLLASALLANGQPDEAAALYAALPPAVGELGLAHVSAAKANPDDALAHLTRARVALGAGWQPSLIAQDPAFEFISDLAGFKALTTP